MTSEAIAELYRVFSPYRTGDEISACSDCVSPQQSHFLATTPLAALTAQDLDNYAFKALTTWGNESDFKHFLPRLFELVSLGRVDAFNFLEVLFGKLAYARWMDWPPAERRAVKEYLRLFWRSQLQNEVRYQEDGSIDTALCALGCACQSVDEFLQMWLESNDATAIRQLAQFIWINAEKILSKNRLWNAHWDGRPGAIEVLVWLKLDEVEQFLRQRPDLFTDHLQYVPGQLEAIRAAGVSSSK